MPRCMNRRHTAAGPMQCSPVCTVCSVADVFRVRRATHSLFIATEEDGDWQANKQMPWRTCGLQIQTQSRREIRRLPATSSWHLLLWHTQTHTQGDHDGMQLICCWLYVITVMRELRYVTRPHRWCRLQPALCLSRDVYSPLSPWNKFPLPLPFIFFSDNAQIFRVEECRVFVSPPLHFVPSPVTISFPGTISLYLARGSGGVL